MADISQTEAKHVLYPIYASFFTSLRLATRASSTLRIASPIHGDQGEGTFAVPSSSLDAEVDGLASFAWPGPTVPASTSHLPDSHSHVLGILPPS